MLMHYLENFKSKYAANFEKTNRTDLTYTHVNASSLLTYYFYLLTQFELDSAFC